MLKARLRGIVPGAGSLGGRALKAGVWSLVQVGGLHVLRLASNLIMTRLLVPEAFGLIALVGTVMTAFTLLSDIGIHRSIVREPDGAEPHFLRVAWVVKMLRGGVIALGVVAAALALEVFGPALAAEGTVYADPRLPWLIALSALVPLLMGVESTNKELALRRVQTGRLAGIEIGAQALSILAMIVFATLSQTVWALMAGMLVNNLAKACASHLVYSGPRMRLIWDSEIADRLWRYGKWLIGSSAFTFVAQNGDRFILGALLNSATFGLYVIAQIWLEAGRQLVMRLNDQVGFSVLGEVVRERPHEVPRLYRKFQTLVDGLCLSAFLGLFLLGPIIVGLLYTSTYAEAGTYLRILSINLLLLRFDQLNFLILNLGMSRAMMGVSALRAAALCMALPAAYATHGLTGALFAVALSPIVSVPYALWLVRPVLGRQVVIDAIWAGVILGFALTLAFTV